MGKVQKPAVVVAGAGIGGATLALALARRGVSVLVIEQAPSFGPLYKGEYLQPRSLEILDMLGVAGAIRGVTHPVHFNRMALETGEVLMDMDLRELGPFEGRNGHHRAIQRAVLASLEALPNAEVRMGTRLTHLWRETPAGARTPAHAEPPAAPWHWCVETNAGNFTALAVAGADGRTSRVRRELGIPADEHPYPGAVLAVTVDVEGETEPRVVQSFGRRDSAFSFPLPDHQYRLYLLLHEDAEAAWLREQSDGGLAHLKARLSAYFPEQRAAIAAIPSMAWVQHLPSFHLLAERWAAPGAVLLGDAAHCVNPARGQGMNLAIADAWDLADVLVGALSATAAPEPPAVAALSAYERRRRPFACYIQRESHRIRRLLLSPNPVVSWLRNRSFRNASNAPRAVRRLTATLAGLKEPPSPMADLLINAATTFPALDPLVPEV